ncbi:MAG: dephospho-CoA kinase [Gammaproteobacteria bacterium]|nr:dephospho-CoA kinase [Gammaproteobacteria bacterium]
MLTVGLTGGIGSGKTTVSNLFENLGIPVIDTDIIARELVINNPSVLNEIVSVFGQAILNQDGTLNRKKLAQIVFQNKEKKQQLENILHPRIRIEVKNKIQSLNANTNPPQYIIVVIPLLFETGFADLADRILVVTADEKTRIERIKCRDDRDIDEIRSIINSQVTDERRLSGADDIIENNYTFKELEAKILHLHNKYINLSTMNTSPG